MMWEIRGGDKLVLSEEFVEFLTLVAYDYID